MNMLYSSAGEVYYLRLLLNTYPTRTLKDFLTRHCSNGLENEANAADNHSAGEVNENGEIHYIRAANTFQEACLFNGLLNDVKEAMTCFEYAMITGTRHYYEIYSSFKQSKVFQQFKYLTIPKNVVQ
jgi:hypothetical protein